MESYNCPFPEDIITDILSRLPAVSALSLKQVCKTWRNLLISPNFALIHLRRHQQSVDPDVHEKDTGACNKSKVSFLCFQRSVENPYESSIFYREYYDDKLQNFSSKKITLNFDGYAVGSCNGLICLSSDYHYSRRSINVYQDPTYVFNPITGEEFSLPKLFIPDNFVGTKLTIASGFGYLPSTNEYKVVRIYNNLIAKAGKVQVYTLGGENSSRHWRDKCEIPFNLRCLNGIFINGALHWFECNRDITERIMAFDLATEEFFVVKSPPFEFYFATLCLLGGCMGVFIPKNRSCQMWVLKKTKKNIMEEKEEYYYDSSWSWCRIFSIDQAGLNMSFHDYLPLAVMNCGKILFKYRALSALCIYDPKTAIFETISCATYRYPRDNRSSPFNHVNTFVSLGGMA